MPEDLEDLIQMKKENQILAEEEQANYASFNRALPVSSPMYRFYALQFVLHYV